MSFKIKMSNIGIVDMVKFLTLPVQRNLHIKRYPASEVSAEFKINKEAKRLHPDAQSLFIEKIIDHEEAEAKTFILKRTDGQKAAFFRAGQYLSLRFDIDGSVVTRPYSISSSPMWAKEGRYAVTIRNNKDGFAAPWALENLKEGDELTASAPEGNFYYDDLRDCENVVAVAGGSGITPFLSMAYAIRDGLENFNLTIIFGSRKENSILFKKELDELSAQCDKIKVVHVLSDEKRKKKGFEKGFVTAELIKKYAPEGDYSMFICGPEAMYRFIDGETEKLGLDKKRIRRELLGVTKAVWECEDYPSECRGKTYHITVKQGPCEYGFEASAEETVLSAIERAGINAPSRCRSGECGWCRSRLVSGTVYIPKENEYRRFTDKEFGYIHPCACFPTSDLVLEVPGSYLE